MKEQNKKNTIMMTGAGGSGTVYIIKKLKDKYRIIVTDMNKHAAGLYLAHKGYTMPACLDERYLLELDKVIEKENVDVFIPLIDEELLAIKKHYSNKEKPKVLLPTENFIELCLNKWNLMNALEKASIPAPKTYLLPSFEEGVPDVFPCIAKPIVSRGSRGFERLGIKQNLKKYQQDGTYKANQLILQEDVQGTEFTVSVVVTHKGEILSVVPKEIIYKKGITKIAVTRKNEKIDEVCKKIQETFKANGPFNVQLILEKDTGLPKVFEINPRFSTTVSLTMEAGVDEVGLLVDSLLGKEVTAPDFQENLVITRYEDQIFLK